MKIAVYSGTFDPITNGHMSIIERASGLFDKVYVAVATDNYKNTLFNEEERLALVKASTANFDNVETEVFSGLLVDYAKSRGACAIVRGLRDIETVFFTADGEFSLVSSSMIRNIASLHGDIKSFVPAPVYEALLKKC